MGNRPGLLVSGGSFIARNKGHHFDLRAADEPQLES